MRHIVIAACFLFSACATPSVLVKKNVSIERLGIYFEPGEHSAPLFAEAFQETLEDFIMKYNSNPANKLELFLASPIDSATLKIKLVGTRMVSKGEQTAGVFVSLMGFSLPFILIAAEAPIILVFYYFPTVRSMTELSLSEDISNMTPPTRGFLLSSPGFLQSTEKQIEKHILSFDGMLLLLVRQVEKQVTARKVKTYATQ